MNIKQYLLLLCLSLLSAIPAHAMFNTFEVGTAQIKDTFADPTMTSISFASSFSSIPLVFVLPSDQGSDPCDVRIQSVSVSGFEAVCAEAPSADGPHVAMDIQYLAILPGVTTIPTSPASDGPITFEAGTIDTQTVQHSCVGGVGACGAEGFDLVNLTSTTDANATIIAQIQTMENESNTPPSTTSAPFLSATVDIAQGSATQFGLALERSEVDDGSITMDETIAWLVVEDTGGSCITLDLSGLGGPAAVPFESIATDALVQGAAGGDIHGSVDGWDNGSNANEGAEFTAGCFTNTPVVVASKRTHIGGDGGWLRQSNISTAEIRLTVDEDTDRDTERSHTREGVSALAFGAAFNTPVTLSHFAIDQIGRNVSFDWETSAETFNLGFNLWGNLAGEWQQLNNRLIPAHRKDQLRSNRYSRNVRLTPYQYEHITEFGISSVDVSGKDEFFGPFEAGESYGEQVIPNPIDWSAIKAQYVQRMASKGYQEVNGIWRKSNASPNIQQGTHRIDIRIPETGLYRITYDDINALGIDWGNVKKRNIAVTFKGKPVARFISGAQNQLRSGSAIEFFASTPTGDDARYIDQNVYQLQLDSSLALPMPLIAHKPSASDANTASTTGLSITNIGENNTYSSLASGDPWTDADIFSFGQSAEKTYNLSLDDVAQNSTGRLTASLVGGLNLSGDVPDHHVLVYVNDVLVADTTSDGFARFEIDEPIPENVLVSGENSVRFVVPGDTGLAFDLISIDTVSLYSSHELSWSHEQDSALTFVAPSNIDSVRIALDERFKKRQARIYVTQEGGNVARVTQPKRHRGDENSIILPTTAMHSELNGDITYWVANAEQMLKPDLQAIHLSENTLDSDIDYIIIAHPAFINQELEDFAESKTNQGLTTQIINWLDIVEQFGHGLSTPNALRRFLTHANLASNYEYVLLVGGHSYDYLDYLGNGSVNFIPAWYGSVDIIQQAPTDTPYVDLDADGMPDKAIGRWPVRTQEDLTAIIKKTHEWQDNGISESRNSLFVAGKTEANRDYDQLLTNAMSPVSKRWTDIHTTFLDELIETEGNNANTVAKQEIIDHINQGVSLTVFNGHGSSSAWALDSLLTSNDVAQLDNAGYPTLLMPLACYTTYYETPSVDSLAHQWLFASQDAADTSGAVAIHGATVFSDYRENTRFAKKVLEQQLDNNQTIGQAILAVKRRLSPWHDMVNNWGLLGDPSLRLVP